MFGHQNDQDQQQDNGQSSDAFAQDNQVQPGQDVWQSASPSPVVTPQDNSNPAFNPSVGAPDSPAEPAIDDSFSAPADAPQPNDQPEPSEQPHDDTPPADVTTGSPTAANPLLDDNDSHDLLDIKQQALTQLSPLVGHLDQSPEEKFRTTMMMIQASDNQTLVPEAYAAAQQISDEKTRAQALLDVINEINYFTQPHNS